MTDFTDIEEGALYLEYACGCYAQPTIREIQARTNWLTIYDAKAHAVCKKHKTRVRELRILWKLPRNR
jgi:hypothetical protein